MSHRQAVEIIQAGGNMIRLGVRRLLPPLLPPQTTSSSDGKSQLPPPPPPMSYAPFPLPITALNPSPVPTGPPNLRLPQLFTPLPVHKAPTSSQRPLLSSAVLGVFPIEFIADCESKSLFPIEFIADCESESITAMVNFVSKQHNWHRAILMVSISPSKA
ncbi:unnamed protein product, partial [Rodentolepis nana]|uniref:ANF_receptor domain-containing protein n=1 Tax=Rodentolepis nana TaxID=102285 RepID=A0A0R3TGW7_RODNA